jgi:polyphosphate kinase 2 (PPK2 family)
MSPRKFAMSEWTALDKGGTIKHVKSCIDPQGCQLCKVSQ